MDLEEDMALAAVADLCVSKLCLALNENGKVPMAMNMTNMTCYRDFFVYPIICFIFVVQYPYKKGVSYD